MPRSQLGKAGDWGAAVAAPCRGVQSGGGAEKQCGKARGLGKEGRRWTPRPGREGKRGALGAWARPGEEEEGVGPGQMGRIWARPREGRRWTRLEVVCRVIGPARGLKSWPEPDPNFPPG